jgi:glycosyltransferase involved in cell wall biosynthesis
LNSLKSQTFQDFEVIVCDDGSDAPIEDLIAAFQSILKIQLFSIENSGGPARPRNIAINEAKSEWVSFLDCDDWWSSDRLEQVLPYLDGSVDVVYHKLAIAQGKVGSEVVSSTVVGHPIDTDPVKCLILSGNGLALSSAIVRRELLVSMQGFDESPNLSSVEDYDLWLRLAFNGAIFHFVDRQFGFYWIGDDNISAFGIGQYWKHRELFSKHNKTCQEMGFFWAKDRFEYVLGSFLVSLNAPGAYQHLKKISFFSSPVLWLKGRLKLLGVLGRRFG